MAQIKLLKIGATGLDQEVNTASDDATLNSFTAGSGPSMSPTGIDMNNTDLSEVSDIDFQDPAVSTIEQTAGALIVDNIMAKERSNSLSTSADILFPSISDTAGQVDALRIPSLSGAPTATPTASGSGFIVHFNGEIYVWNGSAWVSQKDTFTSASTVDKPYVAEVAVAIRDVVYISSSGKVSPASADIEASSRAMGLAVSAAAASVAVSVRCAGILSGFSSLTPGARYFLSASTPGAITSTPPSGASDAIVQVGFAKSATELDLQIVPLSIRA